MTQSWSRPSRIRLSSLPTSAFEERIRQALTTPTRRLVGPPEFCLASPAQHIEQQPFVWDCNGFYRRLGLEPGVPRIEVARAYMALDGHRSSALTTAARTLIDKVTKRWYDRLPLGHFWADDEALVQSFFSGDLDHPETPDWSYYVEDVPDGYSPDDGLVTHTMAIIGLRMWEAGHDFPFAVGFTTRTPRVEILGYRVVALLPLTGKDAVHYASQVASEIVRLGDEAQ
jgi:hypothetical protein